MLCAKYDYKMDIAVKQEEAYEDGLNAGINKGFEQGSREKALETAKKLKQKGIPVETIAECVGLSIEEIERL